MLYDVIIIGSGISGLYAAYKIKKQNPNLSLLVLEKNKKQWIGGRASNETFYGTEVATAAGIGRKADKLLKTLVSELGFEINEFKTIPHYSTLVEPVDVLDILQYLRGEYKKYRGPPLTFKEFAKPLLGNDIYARFLFSAGYTDYEKEDVYETLYNYHMEDNACCLRGFSVHWRKLILELAKRIGEKNIKFLQKVKSISGNPGNFSVSVESGAEYICKKVVVATTITSIRTFFPRNPIYKEIEGQPFLRVYGKFAKQSIPIAKEYIKGYTCVPGPIQKIIPMNPDEGVYMIVYNDNQSTLKLKDRTENTEENRDFYCRLLEKSLGIPSGQLHLIGIRSYYWPIGTHYYKPLRAQSGVSQDDARDEFIDMAQHPEDGILVVGEVVSKHQGWVEGALESVAKVLTKKWIET